MTCENRLTNVFEFKYLGHLFQADGDSFHAAEVRAGMVKTTFHAIARHLWQGRRATKHAIGE